MAEIRDSGIGYRVQGSGVQGFRGSRVQGFKGSGRQGFRWQVEKRIGWLKHERRLRLQNSTATSERME
jgi:hypothetical protein